MDLLIIGVEGSRVTVSDLGEVARKLQVSWDKGFYYHTNMYCPWADGHWSNP